MAKLILVGDQKKLVIVKKQLSIYCKRNGIKVDLHEDYDPLQNAKEVKKQSKNKE